MSGLRASQNTEKLALIPALLYISEDLGGVEWPPNIDLNADRTSLSGGEKLATQGLSRISGYFGGKARAVGGSLMAATMFATPFTAYAQNNSPEVVSAPATVSVVEGDYDCALSQLGTNFRVPTLREPEFSKRDIRDVASVRSRKGIVPTVYGNDPLLGQIVARAVSDARECGASVAGVIIGARSEVGGIDVYGGGALLHEVGSITEKLDLQNAPLVQQQVLRTLLIADSTFKQTQTAELSGTQSSAPATGL